MTPPAFQHCESHPGKSLTDHLADVADRLCSRAPGVRLAGLFHDVAKATGYFQHYLKGQLPSTEPLKQHAHLGAVLLLHHLWPKVGENVHGIDKAILLYLMVAYHHTGLRNALLSLPPDQKEPDRWPIQLQAMDLEGVANWLTRSLGDPVGKPVADLPWSKIRRQLEKALKDGTSDVETMQRFQNALRSFGLLIEADRDSAAGYSPNTFQLPYRFTTGHLEQFRSNAQFGGGEPTLLAARDQLFRSAVNGAGLKSANSGHLWSLTASTGAGKTLAALGWALRRRELRVKAGLPNTPIIYALPFTSIIDQNVAVLRRIWGDAEPDESTLSVHHHVAELGKLARTGEQSLARSWVEGWRADIVSTTFVQVVNALFHGTVADARRFAQLAGSILILDEVQAIPAKFWTLLNVALKTLSGQWKTDILLMTATQPAIFEGKDLQELSTVLPEMAATTFDRYDLFVRTSEEVTLEELAQQVRDITSESEHPSCLVIVNKVQDALDLYDLLRDSAFLDCRNVFHLSTNLRPKDRKRILGEIAKRNGQPHLLIATQVVEAGVDLSFDVVFRALAPLDAIVQAAGRCNRHGIGCRGRVFLVRLAGNAGHLVYGPLLMDAARNVLDSSIGRTLREPDLQKMVVDYFGSSGFAVGENVSMDT